MEGAKLSFTKDSLIDIAKSSIEKKTGARGLRSILENILLEIMYQLPSTDGVEQVVINSDVVKNKRKPLLIFGNKKNKINSSA